MDYIVCARNARGVQGLRASRRGRIAARLDCPVRDNRMPMQVPAGAEGASAAELVPPKAALGTSGRCGLRTSIPSPDGPDRVLRSGCPSLSESCMRDAARAALSGPGGAAEVDLPSPGAWCQHL